MRVLYSYVVAYDSGFAPNPFNGFCTLATCKPEIRKRANIGDWIIGTGSHREGVRRGGFLVYAMRVEEALSADEVRSIGKTTLTGTQRAWPPNRMERWTLHAGIAFSHRAGGIEIDGARIHERQAVPGYCR